MTMTVSFASSTLKRLLPAAVLAAGLAAPLAMSAPAEARDGCGPGFHRGVYGWCRPNLRPRAVFVPYAYRPAFYGPRRFHGGGPRWRRWGVVHRPVGWHRGWHRRW